GHTPPGNAPPGRSSGPPAHPTGVPGGPRGAAAGHPGSPAVGLDQPGATADRGTRPGPRPPAAAPGWRATARVSRPAPPHAVVATAARPSGGNRPGYR